MARLNHGQFDSLLDCIGELYAHHDLDGFAQLAMTVGRKLVPADYAIFEEMNLRHKRHTWVTDPPNVNLNGPEELHAHYFKEHPMVRHLARTGDMPPLRLSDFFSRQQYHETALYREVFRNFGVEYQLGFSLPSPSPRFYVAMAFNRKRRNFTEEDRLTFELLRRHLFQAYRNADLITQLREMAAFSSRALEATRQGVIELDPQGRIRFCSASARQWIATYFAPLERPVKDKLPQKIQQWMRLQAFPAVGNGHIPPPRQPLTIEQNGRRLIMRLVASSGPGQQVLVLDERATSLSPAPLARLGLTPCEAEVLLWVSQGKTSPEIGLILNSSTGTVNKHLEHIFAKLGVETRTAAAALAFEVLNGNTA